MRNILKVPAAIVRIKNSNTILKNTYAIVLPFSNKFEPLLTYFMIFDIFVTVSVRFFCILSKTDCLSFRLVISLS